MATVLRCCAAQDPKPPLCCPTCTSTVDAPCRTPGYGTDNCDFQQVRGRLFRAAPCLQRLASSSWAHLVRPRQDNCWGEELEEGETYCQNGGTCKNKIADYDCICIDGWTGEAALYRKRRMRA